MQLLSGMDRRQGWSVFLTLIIAFTAILFLRIRLIGTYTPDIGGIEQNVILSCQKVGAGIPLYSDPEKIPFSFTQYSPLYFYVVGLSGRLLGLSTTEPFPWFFLSRLYSLIFNILTVLVFYKLTGKIAGHNKLLHAGLALLLFISFEQHDYSRPDSLYHLLFSIVIYFCYLGIFTGHNRKKIIYLSLAGLATSLSVFTKQSGLMVLIFIMVYGFWEPVNRKYIWSCLVSFSIISLALSFLLLPEPADILLKNMWLGIMNGVDLHWAMYLFLVPALTRYVLIFSLFASMTFRWRVLKENAISHFLMAGIMFFCTVALLEGLKWGSGTNYFFEFILLTLLNVPFLFRVWNPLSPGGQKSWSIWTVTLLLIVSQVILVYWRDYYKSDKALYLQEKRLVSKMQNTIYQSEDRYIAVLDRKWLNNFFFDRSLFPQPDIYMNLWQPDPSKSKIHPRQPCGNFRLFVVQSDRSPLTSFYHLDLKGYTPVDSLDNLLVSTQTVVQTPH